MKVDVGQKNEALSELLQHDDRIIFLDTNLFIAPDRSNLLKGNRIRGWNFEEYREAFLDPLFHTLQGMAIHETVYREMIGDEVRAFADEKIQKGPGCGYDHLQVFNDKILNANELALLRSTIEIISQFSQYQPDVDNAKDRGEVRSLAFMHVKGFLYFSSNDNLPIRLIEQAGELHTSLDDMSILKSYDMIYLLWTHGQCDRNQLRVLYKYLYRLTRREKADNPDWQEFIKGMDRLYE